MSQFHTRQQTVYCQLGYYCGPCTGHKHPCSNLDLLVDLCPEHSFLGVISLRQDLDNLLGARLMSQKRQARNLMPNPLDPASTTVGVAWSASPCTHLIQTVDDFLSSL